MHDAGRPVSADSVAVRLFDRCAVDWGETPSATRALPTDERLAAYKEGGQDPDLEELQFQYARYLMIASSRPGTLPAGKGSPKRLTAERITMSEPRTVGKTSEAGYG